MGDSNQAYTLNQDGSITINLDGRSTKFVKESDLGAVKGALRDKESEVSKLQAELAGTTSRFDTEHQEVLKERAAKEQFEKDAKEVVNHRTKVAELTTQLAGLTKTSGETQARFTERLRKQLNTLYKISDDKLKDKALADLENIESTLQLTGVMPAVANYDGKGSGGNNASGLQGKSPLALATMGYENSNRK